MSKVVNIPSKLEVYRFAMNIVPSTEQIKKQVCYIYDNDLVFYSSTNNAWFVVKEFIDSDINIRLPVDILDKIISIPGNLQIRSKGADKNCSVMSDKFNLEISPIYVDEIPEIKIPDDSMFRDIPKDLKYIRSYRSFNEDGFTRVTNRHFDNHNLTMMVTKNSIIGHVSKNEETLGGISIDNFDTLVALAAYDSKIFIDKGILYSKTIMGNNVVYGGIKMKNIPIPDAAFDYIKKCVFDDPSNHRVIEYTMSISEAARLSSIMNNFQDGGLAEFSIESEDNLKVSYSTFNMKIDVDIDVQASGSLTYKGAPFNVAFTNVLTSINDKKSGDMVDTITCRLFLDLQLIVYISEVKDVKSFIIMKFIV